MSEGPNEDLGEIYDRMLKDKRAINPIQKDCHDCGAKPGELHKEGCDSPTCTICGIQLFQCGHNEGNSVHTGIEGQEIMILAEALGLYTKWTEHGWEECDKNDEGARYDLNRAIIIYQKSLIAVRKREENKY